MEKFFDPVVHDIDVQVDAMLASTDLQKIKVSHSHCLHSLLY